MFEQWYEVLALWCPPGKLQYWRGFKRATVLRSERDVSRKTAVKRHALTPKEQFLFMMVQLHNSIPSNQTCPALFSIHRSRGTEYFTTWLLLMKDFLRSAFPVNKDVDSKPVTWSQRI
eukprot:5662536-Pleurochrysis_carterae.AAC.2